MPASARKMGKHQIYVLPPAARKVKEPFLIVTEGLFVWVSTNRSHLSYRDKFWTRLRGYRETHAGSMTDHESYGLRESLGSEGNGTHRT